MIKTNIKKKSNTDISNISNISNNNLIKIIRAIILFISIYFVTKYFTIGKIPYNEIIMICSSAVLIQVLLDIYRPIITLTFDHNNYNN
jgi:hypothetical protein